VLPFDLEAAEAYSRIRAEHNVSPADAIHLACAVQARVELFLTNGRQLGRLHIPGIHFIASLDTNLFLDFWKLRKKSHHRLRAVDCVFHPSPLQFNLL